MPIDQSLPLPQFNAPDFAQPKQYGINPGSIDAVFGAALQQRIGDSLLKQRQFELSQAQGQQRLQALTLGFDPTQLTPDQVNQAQAPAPPAGADPDHWQAIHNYVARTRAGQILGMQSQQADITAKTGQAAEAEANARRLNTFSNWMQQFVPQQSGAQQSGAQQSGAQNVPQGAGQGITQGTPTPPSTQKIMLPSIRDSAGNQFNIVPGANGLEVSKDPVPGTAPMPNDRMEVNALVNAENYGNQMFNLYNKIAAKGKTGPLAGAINATLAELSKGKTDPDILAFKRMEGLIGNLKGPAGESGRLPFQIIDMLQGLAGNPNLDPAGMNALHREFNTAVENNMKIYTTRYPQEADAVAKIRKAIGTQTVPVGSPANSPQRSATDIINEGRAAGKSRAQIKADLKAGGY